MKQISSANKKFIRNAIITENKRTDLRSDRQYRDLRLVFGQEFGTCFVRLGQTIIFTTTSCEVTEPKIGRPNDGLLELSLDLCSGSEKWLDSYQRPLPPEGVQCLRLLDRTIRDSRCLDIESLCLVSGLKVWRIKCHMICLNFDGNLAEAASIGAIASLSHFKRPDVTTFADRTIKVHSFDERNPLNLTLLHNPFCVLFVFFFDNNSKIHTICDPNECEEESADACLTIGANSYREIVAIHCSGKPALDSERVTNCSRIAIERVKQLTEIVKQSLRTDCENRAVSFETIGFANAIRTGIMSSIERPHLNLLDVIRVEKADDDEPMDQPPEELETQNVYLYGRGMASIGSGGETKWSFETPVDSDDSNDVIIESDVNKKNKKQQNLVNIDSEEEEDEVMILDFKTNN